MNRLRRPWTIQRQNTDGVQMNTLDDTGKKTPTFASDEEHGSAEKTGFQANAEPADVQQGHLQEIEVDLNHVVHDQELKDIDSDTSPYPEVVSVHRDFILELDANILSVR